ncbi:MAG: iron ABC transporter permease [Pseudomonadota bacterium]
MSRFVAAHAIVGAVLLGLILQRLAGGSPPADLAAALAGDPLERVILLHFRLPRLVLAMAVGAALGMAGSALQVMLRNPLASPDIIGFGAGAAAGAAGAILILGEIGAAVPGALTGGALTAALVMALAWRDGVSPLSLVLIGLALGLMLTTLTDILLSLSPAILASETARFLTGSFASADWRFAGWMSLATAVGGAVLLRFAFRIDRLAMGDDLAVTLGLAPDSIRLSVAATAALLVAASVAVAGPIPFIAFLAGPIARFAADEPGTVLPLAALVGGTLGVAADSLAGVPVGGTRLPAGVFTAMIGGPAMLILLLRLEVDRK